MTPTEVIRGAIGPFPDHCAGYLNPGASGGGYIATLKLSVGVVDANMDTGLEGIVAYDRAEKWDAYIGQINMLTASSFCGLNGLIWGYDLAREPDVTADSNLLYTMKGPKDHDGPEIPIRSIKPLLDAARRLFGTEETRRFPPLPGAMVVCANKSITKAGPPKGSDDPGSKIWCTLALAIAKDRTKDACLFIEDASDSVEDLENLHRNIVRSILYCGLDQGVAYKEIFIGYKDITVKPGKVGCALTCAPYVTLAQNAIPEGYVSEDLLKMSIDEWEQALHLGPLEGKEYPVKKWAKHAERP